MPIDSIEYFGLSDTVNPFTGNPVTKVVNNIYEIKLFGNTGSAVVNTGLIPSGGNYNTLIAQVIEPSDGSVIETLQPLKYDHLSVMIPSTVQCILFDIDQFQSSLYVNTDYVGKYLKITMDCLSCSVMGDWMNTTRGDFMEIRGIGSDDPIQGSWILCDGSEVNRFLYPRYYTKMQAMGFPYGQENDNPLTPNLTYHSLLGTGGGKISQAPLGLVENKSLWMNIAHRHKSHYHYLRTGTGFNSSSGQNSGRTIEFSATINTQTDTSHPYVDNNYDYLLYYDCSKDDVLMSDIQSSPHIGVNWYMRVV
ncbi:MAG: hypothetical protein ACRC0A_01575 [Chitinophagaceae bacterium]